MAFADLDKRGVEPQIRRRLPGERAGAEGLDLGIEGSAELADLAATHRGDPESLDHILDPPGRDAQHVRFLDDRQKGPLCPSAGFQ